MKETLEGLQRRAELLDVDSVIEIEIRHPGYGPASPNTVVGGHNEEDHNEGGGGGGGSLVVNNPVQGAPVARPQVTTATVNIESPGTLRPTIPLLESVRIPPITLQYEAAPEWVRQLPKPAAAAILAGWPRPTGDTQVYGFPIADDVRVVLDGTMREPGRVEIDGVATDILVHPVYDDAGEISGFAPDSYLDQDELQKATGAWVALSENGSAQDTQIVVVGEGSVRGEGKTPKGSTQDRRATKAENRGGLLIAGQEGRHLERIPNPTDDKSKPDYIDVDTKERIDIYAPQSGNVNTIRNQIRKKMKADQADIIVVDVYYAEQSLPDILERIETMKRDRPVSVIDPDGRFHYFEPNVDSPADLGDDRPVPFA